MNMNMTHGELRTLIDEGAFELYGQPKWTFGKNTCNTYEVFAEVLRLPGGETVPGYEYVRRIAYDGETSKAFSAWFLENSLGMMRRLTDETGCALVAAINTWSHSINEPDFVEKTTDALGRYGFTPENLEFELSEVDRLNRKGIENLNALREMGVKLLLDSFGIGRNNLFALNLLPFDGIKLPRCFAAGVPSDEKLVRILVSIAHLADTLGLTVCAKGIENGDQFEFFDDLGFWKGQGFMIGAPMGEKKLREFITQFGQKK